ncbi:MAG: cobaltochelatase subunit CobN [Parahaliea sp.]
MNKLISYRQLLTATTSTGLRLLTLWLFLVDSAWTQPAIPSTTDINEHQLLVLASQRNAETIADAARQFSERYPGYRIVARSDTQLWEMTPSQVQSLLADADMVLGLGLFGATVAELEPLLLTMAHTKTPLLIFNSDHRLIRHSRLRDQSVFSDDEQLRHIAGIQPSTDFHRRLDELVEQYPQQGPWIEARRYWQAGGSANVTGLFAWAFRLLGANITAPPAEPQPRLRWQYRGEISTQLPVIKDDAPLLVILDHAGGDRPADNALLRKICQQARQEHGHECLIGLAYWGEASVEAVRSLAALQARLGAVVMLQDFVMGAGEGRATVTEGLSALAVPVLKAIKMRDRTALEHQFSSDGLAHDKVYYQVAMPELQGASQPLIVAAAGGDSDDPLTGIRIQPVTGVSEGINALLSRIGRWRHLQTTPNADKRIAIIYYNHPPGRHNIGADNLDVPASVWQMLKRLQAQGYNTGELPASQAELLDLMQTRAINLPNDAGALQSMSATIEKMPADAYRQWFDKLPIAVQREMTDGPFGLLHERIRAAVAAGQPALASEALAHTMGEMQHLLEGVNHPGRERAVVLLAQLKDCYHQSVLPTTSPSAAPPACEEDPLTLIRALQQTGIEGLGGWGEVPGEVMTYQGQLLLPGLRFGNIFIGPQPPRGWEINEELLHANLAFPPPHQYLAFYHYLHDSFKADAIIHLGRHSTYEFLPRRSVGLAGDDYPRIVTGDIPGIYPYIVDGVGEGIQAKRRGLAVMVDHLTPPLQHTPLYDELLQLRQLVESFEASHGSDNQAMANRLVQQIRDKVDALELRDELAQAMSAELAIKGISFEEVNDDMLVHEVGHYLTTLQERFMPLGLHIFGKHWDQPAINMMLDSMAPTKAGQREQWQTLLVSSPDAEMEALLQGMNGGFIAPGPGNDPIRSPESLPTGRNFYALDNSLVPSRVAWELGREIAARARANNPQTPDGREALVLWASDVVRDEGIMIAFGLDMLGLKPVWNSRGLVKGLARRPLAAGEVRRDMVFTISGLFRDLYGRQMLLLDQATLMALDASANTIVRDYPTLTLALKNALRPLRDSDFYGQQQGGSESLAQNQVAAHWVKQTQQLLLAGRSVEDAGMLASLRVFGDAPGSYGASVNRLVERSGAWQQRKELANVYLRRLGHSYSRGGAGGSRFGAPAEDVFRTVLADVENTYLGRASNLYGLIDNDDAFDYLGGLSLAVETLTGKAPNNFVLNHANPENISAEPLGLALRRELRGRFLNPQWLKGLMEHGYAGARTMGSAFLEHLWGWQVTNPTLVGDWAWQEVKEVYVDDRYGLELDEFFEQGHNVHVKSNMLAIMLVAIHKGFWQADADTTAHLASEFARLVRDKGLPGSGHTSSDHPMLSWLEQHLLEEDWQVLAQVIERTGAALLQQPEQHPAIHRLAEIELKQRQQQQKQTQQTQAAAAEAQEPDATSWRWLLLPALLLIIVGGFYHSLRHAPHRGCHHAHQEQGESL